MPLVFLLFIIVPIVELWLLIKVGSVIGALPTVALVFLTAIIGVTLLRQQGVSTLLRANRRMQSGEIPATEMGEGIFLAIGGALLLTPGFITDAVGFACLIPGVRRWLLRRAMRHVKVVQFGGPGQFREPPERNRPSRRDSHTIEGEYRRDD